MKALCDDIRRLSDTSEKPAKEYFPNWKSQTSRSSLNRILTYVIRHHNSASAKASLTLQTMVEVFSTQFSEKQLWYQQQSPKSSGASTQPGSRKLAKCDRNC